MTTMRRIRRIAIVALLTSGALAPRATHAQTLAGQIRDAVSRAPLVGIRAMLVSDSGIVIAEDTSRSSGIFYLAAPRPGSFSIAFASDGGVLLGQGEVVAFLADSTLQKEYLLAIPRVEAAYTRQQVDRAARQLPMPHGMLSLTSSTTREIAPERRELLLQFIVDAEGIPDPATIKVVRHSDERFERSVIDLVPMLRYEPALKDGRKVRQIVDFGLRVQTRTVRIERRQ